MQDNYQAHPNLAVTFAHLRDVCLVRGWTVRMNLFECGSTVTVLDASGKRLTSATWRCEDDLQPDAATMCAEWLVVNNKLTLADFNAY